MKSLKRKAEFTRIYFKGKKLNSKHLTLFALEDNNIELKLGIVVKKKIGNAVMRNRIRRILKNSFKVVEEDLNKKLSILAVFRYVENLKSSPINFWEIKNEISRSLSKMNSR